MGAAAAAGSVCNPCAAAGGDRRIRSVEIRTDSPRDAGSGRGLSFDHFSGGNRLDLESARARCHAHAGILCVHAADAAGNAGLSFERNAGGGGAVPRGAAGKRGSARAYLVRRDDGWQRMRRHCCCRGWRAFLRRGRRRGCGRLRLQRKSARAPVF